MWDLLVLPALGLLEFFVLGLFFIALVIGTAFDRSNNIDAPKWWILLIGVVVGLAWFWKDWTFSGAWDTVTSWAFWKPACIYLLLGLGYSLIEFGLAVRRAARRYADLWRTWTVQKSGTVADFISRNFNRHALIGLEQVDGKPSPKVDKEELAASIGAWTFFWPAYFVSLIFGDLFIEIFRWISTVLVTISGRFVRMAFKDVFQ